MPKGVYIRTKQARINMSKAHIGIPLSKEHCLAISRYSRSLKQLKALEIGREIARKIPRSEKQREASRKLGKLPNTLAQNRFISEGMRNSPKAMEACRENGRKNGAENGRKSVYKLRGLVRGPETKRKMRIAALNRVGQVCPNYNPVACRHFEAFDKRFAKLGCPTGYYATNGGEFYIKELGYFLDYFNPDLKLIIEWDEPGHYDREGNLNKKDIQRQREIQEIYPDFRFVRIKQETFNL